MRLWRIPGMPARCSAFLTRIWKLHFRLRRVPAPLTICILFTTCWRLHAAERHKNSCLRPLLLDSYTHYVGFHKGENMSTLSNRDNHDVCLAMVRPLMPTWEAADIPFWIKGLHGRFVYANPKYKDLTGLPLNFDIEWLKDSELPEPTSSAARWYRKHEQAMINEDEYTSSLEVINTEPDNTFTVFYFNKYPLYDMNKQIIGEMFMGSHFPGVSGMSQFG